MGSSRRCAPTLQVNNSLPLVVTKATCVLPFILLFSVRIPKQNTIPGILGVSPEEFSFVVETEDKLQIVCARLYVHSLALEGFKDPCMAYHFFDLGFTGSGHMHVRLGRPLLVTNLQVSGPSARPFQRCLCITGASRHFLMPEGGILGLDKNTSQVYG
jgi:hypothetical protein